MNQPIETAISNYFSQWLGHHPYLVWSISHPLPSLGLLILLAFIVGGLIKAVGRVFEQIGLWVLKTPFKLLQPLFRVMSEIFLKTLGRGNSIDPNLTSDRIDVVVDRLQSLSQEQERLLKELATLRRSADRSC